MVRILSMLSVYVPAAGEYIVGVVFYIYKGAVYELAVSVTIALSEFLLFFYFNFIIISVWHCHDYDDSSI